MSATTPCELLPLRIRHWNGLRCDREAVPEFFDQLKPILDVEREGALHYCAHDRILRW